MSVRTTCYGICIQCGICCLCCSVCAFRSHPYSVWWQWYIHLSACVSDILHISTCTPHWVRLISHPRSFINVSTISGVFYYSLYCSSMHWSSQILCLCELSSHSLTPTKMCVRFPSLPCKIVSNPNNFDLLNSVVWWYFSVFSHVCRYR